MGEVPPKKGKRLQDFGSFWLRKLKTL